MTEHESVAIVTAAGRGIGAGCARALAARGYRLALMSPSGAPEVARELGAIALAGSVTEEADLRALVDAALEAHGRIDAVVNNTGHAATGPFLEISDAEWHEGLDLYVLNAVRMARVITPVMVEQGGGAIVNVSAAGVFEPSARYPLSATLRAALASFTKLYANAYAAAGIRMNSIMPGFVDNYPEDAGILATIPMGRYAQMSEIGDTVAFLLSPEAGYITGQNLVVDGGMSRSY